MTRTALVTGAHGFIGRHVARRLAAAGWRVLGTGHGDWPREQWSAWGLSQWHPADLERDGIGDWTDGVGLVVHCAGGSSVGASLHDPAADFARNVGTTLQVLEFARTRARRARVLLLSSAGVYGEGSLPNREDDPLQPLSPYGVHKRMAEQLARSYADNFGLSVAVLRLFSVYGAGLRKQLLWDACNKVGAGDYAFAGSGEELRDFIHVEDVASLVEHVAAQAGEGFHVYNGGAGTGVSVAEILGLLFAQMDVSAPPRFTGQARAGDPRGYTADVGRARALGWQPRVPLREGIREFVEWFRAQ